LKVIKDEGNIDFGGYDFNDDSSSGSYEKPKAEGIRSVPDGPEYSVEKLNQATAEEYAKRSGETLEEAKL
jgi:hypothetical protein